MAFTSGRSAVAGLLTTWLNREFVKDLEWILQYQKFTAKAIIPPGSGKIGRFNVFVPPPASTSYSGASTTALTERFTTEHEITDITSNSTDITISEYGEFYATSQLAMYAAVPGAREKLQKRLRDGANLTIDSLVLTAFNTAATNYLYASTDQTGAKTTVAAAFQQQNANAAMIIQARKILIANKAPGFTGIAGHPEGQYAAILSPKQELDIVTESTTGRMYWSQAVTNIPGAEGQSKWVRGYLGSIYGVACYVTQNYGTGTATASTTGDIGFVVADGAVGAVAFKDMAPEVILNDINSPYKNVDSVAWHVFFGTSAIDTVNRVVKMYSNS